MRRRVIDDRFELVERLGGGGMGLVWRAWDVALHREVALKEVRPPDPSMDEHDPAAARELRSRVLREARALARLNHPHVATIHHIVDPGEHGYPWIVMELVTGGSLQDRLQRGPMPPQEAARLGREVLSALRAAHAVGIQHRDVKPANVLLRADGRSVLTDFGIAAVRESTNLTATGAFIGSPEYMAPERINGLEGDPASDLWSLGMMLYVAVEGRHPLRRSTTLATLAAVLNQDVPPPERAGALTPVLIALLRRDPAARPDAETLDRLLTDPGPAPYPPPAPATPEPAMPPVASGPQTVPPRFAGAQTVPPMPGYARPAQQPPSRPRRAARNAVLAALAVSAAVVVVVGVLVWRLLPAVFPDQGDDPDGGRLTLPSVPMPTRGLERENDDDTPETPARTASLLTSAGIRDLIAKVKSATGGSKVVRMSVHATHAVINAPIKRDKELYDTYMYRDGELTRSSAGGTVDGPLADLDAYNWDALPGLLKRASTGLGVPKPTTRYLIVDPDFAFANPRQVLLVYASDGYRSGYLVANLQGKVVKTYPHD
ncbi:serine/threonine-protein kinase [Nonomuraea purpurea]|uniref:non-specific serine/threonine protein kinase n=1 Tax=Nonomuraea purpurea TaxID=1849276 RepID=A0ABV8G4F4_9ACTN